MGWSYLAVRRDTMVSREKALGSPEVGGVNAMTGCPLELEGICIICICVVEIKSELEWES